MGARRTGLGDSDEAPDEAAAAETDRAFRERHHHCSRQSDSCQT